MRKDTNYDGPTITVRQVRSAIGNKPKNRGTLRALGLRKIGDTNTLPDRKEIRAFEKFESVSCCEPFLILDFFENILKRTKFLSHHFLSFPNVLVGNLRPWIPD